MGSRGSQILVLLGFSSLKLLHPMCAVPFGTQVRARTEIFAVLAMGCTRTVRPSVMTGVD
jgi:hypothetical protein